MPQTRYEVHFAQFLEQLSKEYERHYPKKKDSWLTMSIRDIQLMVSDVYYKWYTKTLQHNISMNLNKKFIEAEFDELVDLGNLINMLGMLMMFKYKEIN